MARRVGRRLQGTTVARVRNKDGLVAIADVIACITRQTADAARRVWARLLKTHPNLAGVCTRAQFPLKGRGRPRLTPATDAAGIVQLAMVLPGKAAVEVRRTLNNVQLCQRFGLSFTETAVDATGSGLLDAAEYLRLYGHTDEQIASMAGEFGRWLKLRWSNEGGGANMTSLQSFGGEMREILMYSRQKDREFLAAAYGAFKQRPLFQRVCPVDQAMRDRALGDLQGSRGMKPTCRPSRAGPARAIE